MKQIKGNWMIIFGWLAVFAAIIFMFKIWMTRNRYKPEADNSPKNEALRDWSLSLTASDQNEQAEKHEMRDHNPESRSEVDLAADTRLRSFLTDGDLGAIYTELTKIADARRLYTIRELLKDWSRDESMEIAQWCLAISEQYDPELNLELSAEALSNSSEIIREFAACNLEEISGIRFEDSRQANKWLKSHMKK